MAFWTHCKLLQLGELMERGSSAMASLAQCVLLSALYKLCLMRLMRLQVVVLLLVDILLLPVPFTRVVLHDHSWAQVWLQSMLYIIV